MKTKILLVLLLAIVFISIGAKCPWEKDDDKEVVYTGSSGGSPPAAPVPLAPQSLTAVYHNSGFNYWELHWADCSTNEEYFSIEIQPGGTGAFELVGTVSANEETVNVLGDVAVFVWFLNAKFRVLAVNANGSSLPSNVAP